MSRSPVDSREATKRFLSKLWGPIDELGKVFFGELWQDVYLSIQDALALSVLVKLPAAVNDWVLGGESFSSFSTCIKEEVGNPNQLACFVVVGSTFLFWLLLAGRLLGRFLENVLRFINRR